MKRERWNEKPSKIKMKIYEAQIEYYSYDKDNDLAYTETLKVWVRAKTLKEAVEKSENYTEQTVKKVVDVIDITFAGDIDID